METRSPSEVLVDNASGASAVNIQDGGNSITVDGTVGISGTVPVSGPLTDTQLRATAVPVSGTFFQATQPVSGTVTALGGAAATTSATLQSAVSASGNGSALSVDGMAAIAFTVKGTFGGGTSVSLQGSEDGGTTYSTLGFHSSVGGAYAGSTTSGGTFFANVAGLTHIRTPVAWVSGTSVTVTAHATPATLGMSYPTVAIGQVAGTNIDTNSGVKSAGTVRVVLATDQPALTTAMPISAASLPLPSGASTAAKQPALGTAGTASADVITVQGKSGMTSLVVDGSGVTQPVSAVSLPLPSGASTAAKQPSLGTAGSASADVISVQGVASMTALKVDGSGVTQPISGSVTANAGTNLNTSALALDATLTGGTQKTKIVDTAGTNVATVSAAGAVKVDGSAVTQPVSGTVTANAGSGTMAVSAASLPLPSGASTAAKQPALGTAGSASADVLSVQGVASMTALKVDGSGVTQPVSGTVTAPDNQVIVDNAAFTDGTSKVFMSGYILDEAAGTALTENDAAAARIDSKRAVVHVIEDATTRGRRATVSSGGAILTDASATTQPISGTVTNTPAAPTTIFNGGKTVTTAGTRVTLAASQAVQSVTIRALNNNAGRIYVGNSTVSSANGYELFPGESISMDIANLNTVNLDAASNGDGVTYMAVN